MILTQDADLTAGGGLCGALPPFFTHSKCERNKSYLCFILISHRKYMTG